MNVLVFDRKTENFDNTKGIIQLFGLDVYDFESLKYNGKIYLKMYNMFINVMLFLGLFTFGILAIIIVLNLLTNSLLILGTVMVRIVLILFCWYVQFSVNYCDLILEKSILFFSISVNDSATNRCKNIVC